MKLKKVGMGMLLLLGIVLFVGLLCSKKPVDAIRPRIESMEDALFIGDSRALGLAEYSDLHSADFFATVGLTPLKALQQRVTVPGVGKVTLNELLSGKKYGKIYIVLGVNALKEPIEKTVDCYACVVDFVRRKQPDAVVFLLANIHVTRERSDCDPYYNNPMIDRLNHAIATMANDKTVFYLDANALFDDENGNLAQVNCVDSAHLSAKLYREWGTWVVQQTCASLKN